MKRISYLNPFDRLRHVLLGGLDEAQAVAVMARWAAGPLFNLGADTRIEDCDGTADGVTLTKESA